MPDDLKFMQRALALADQGVGLASPNPTVGCVIVKNGKVVGEGFHDYDRLDHAEIVALRQAGEKSAGATIYVNLEPCSHYGRTPPCANALIAAGVSRVVIATLDPNPKVAGRGAELLQAAGITVETGMLEAEARRLNDAFAKFITTGRPFVLLKSAISLDGRIAPPRGTLPPGQRMRVTGPAAHARVQLFRHAADAIVTGIGTVLADDALLTDRSGLPRRRPLLRVVLDSQLRIPLDSALVRSANHDLLVCYHHAPPEKEVKVAELREKGVRLLQIPSRGGLVSPAAVFRHLGELEMPSILIEAGAQLATHVISAGTIDAVALFVAPIFMGANAIPLFVAKLPHPVQLQQLQTETLPPDTLLTGYVRNPWDLKGTAAASSLAAVIPFAG
jgi:diaminohydroxyphosphoribosylaminopyrimidine deaminase/5-amino-6-(5-phosphoribosylamino)uracil reductase